jgi:hypothetical protein
VLKARDTWPEEWTYRWLAAALTAYEDEVGSDQRFATLRRTEPLLEE